MASAAASSASSSSSSSASSSSAASNAPQYQISVTINKAEHLKIGDLLTKSSDPFVVVKVDNQTQKTRVIKKNLHPVWNTKLNFTTSNQVHFIECIIYDEDTVSNDYLGTVLIPITENDYDVQQHHQTNPFIWYDIQEIHNKSVVPGSGRLQVQVKVTNIHMEKKIQADYHAMQYTHLVAFTLQQARNLKKVDLIGENDPFAEVHFAGHTYRTKVIHNNNNPVWEQKCFIWLNQNQHGNYKVQISVYDKDLRSHDLVGHCYVDISDILQQQPQTYDAWIPLLPRIAENDASLSSLKAADDNQDQEKAAKTAASILGHEICGEVHVVATVTSKAEIEKTFFQQLVSRFGSGDNKLSKVEVRAMMETLGSNMDDAAFEEFFHLIDADANGEVIEEEFVHFLSTVECQSSTDMSRLLAFLQSGAQGVEAALMGGVTHNNHSSDEIMVKDRETGLLVRENIPNYIKTALKSMSCSRIGRKLAAKCTSLMQTLSARQGEKYSRPESVHDLPAFIALHHLNLDEVEKPLDQYATFNEFFARGLKPEARPIYHPEDPNTALIPADCRLMVFPEITDAKLWVKGDQFSIENLLGPCAAKYADRFLGGSFVIARLAPQDYHRWHFPVTGKVYPETTIPGSLYTVNPIAINQNVNVYTENKRMIIPMETAAFGTVLVMPIAATMVGSIELYAKGSEEGTLVNKGDQSGSFSFGGSTILLLFEPNRIEFDPELVAHSKQPIETLVKVNTYLGKALRPQL